MEKNYKILNYEKSKICYIFITSHGIKLKQINDDFFQWERIAKHNKIKNNSGKIIFIRDNLNSFYVEGLNSEIQCIEELISFFEKETRGYDVILCGHSAGGYLAFVLGSFLANAIRVLSFGGINDVYQWRGAFNHYTFDDKPLLKKHKNDNKYNKYFKITKDMVSSKNIFFHAFGIDNLPDYQQYRIIKEEQLCINTFGFKSNKHCSDISSFNLVKLLTCKNKRFGKIINKKSGKNNWTNFSFCIQCFGLLTFLKSIFYIINNKKAKHYPYGIEY